MKQQRTEIPEGPPLVLRGKEAEAFLKYAAKPPTKQQILIVRRALEEFGDSSTGH